MLDSVSEEGVICPCCECHDKIYDRRITVSGVRGVVSLYKWTARNGDGYHHYKKFVRDSQGEFTRLRHIGLIERRPKVKPAKKTSGMYRITSKGKSFIRGDISVPERMLLYHDELVGQYGEEKYITDVWPVFNYRELMES